MDKIKLILSALDIPEDLAEKEVDEITSTIKQNYVHKNMLETDPDVIKVIDSRVGKRLGSVQTKLAQNFGLSASEYKDKKIEEAIELAAQKQKTKIEELEESINKSDASEWKKKIDQISKEKQALESLAADLKTQVETTEKTYQEKIKSTKTDYELTRIKASLPFAENFDELKREGFEARLGKMYKFELDEETGKLKALDKDGNPVKNEKNTGFLSAEEVIKNELEKVGGLKKADKGGVKKPSTFTQDDQSEKKIVRQLHPNAVR